MIRAFAVIAMSAALGLLATSSATASDHRHDRGFVMPCSLDGINPVFHSDIFGNSAAARSYGFVRSPDGTRQLHKDCQRY